MRSLLLAASLLLGAQAPARIAAVQVQGNSLTADAEVVSSADEFLGLLGDEDRAELERIGHRRQADRPDVLLARGDEADRVLVLEAGRVKVTVPTPSGTDAVLTFRGPGALLGEQALVDRRPRSADVWADSNVECLEIAIEDFERFQAAHPAAGAQIMRNLGVLLAKRLSQANTKIDLLSAG